MNTKLSHAMHVLLWCMMGLSNEDRNFVFFSLKRVSVEVAIILNRISLKWAVLVLRLGEMLIQSYPLGDTLIRLVLPQAGWACSNTK